MLHQVDFAGAIGVPEIDGEHIERGIDFTNEVQSADAPEVAETAHSKRT